MSVMKSLLLLIQTQKQHPFKKRFGCRVGASQFYYPGNSTSWGEREEAVHMQVTRCYFCNSLKHLSSISRTSTRSNMRPSVGIAGLRARAVQISGEGNFLSYSSNKAVSGLGNDDKQANQPNGTEIQPDAVALATLSAEIIPTSMGFYSDDDDFDLDCPTEGFSSIPEAIEDIHQGKRK